MFTVELIVCSRHGTQALSLADESGGYRFAGSKCCGSWKAKKSWPMSASALADAAEQFAKAAKAAEDAA